MRVLLFGRLGDVAGWRERAIDPPAPDLPRLRAHLEAETPALREALAAKGVQVAVDQVLVREAAAPLGPTSEVAFLPPMSGG